MLYQPFFLNATSRYTRHVMDSYGISHFYTFVAENDGSGVLGIPDGCTDMLLCCSNDKRPLTVCGTGLSPRKLNVTKGERYFGVRFLPGFFMTEDNQLSFADTVGKDIFYDKLTDMCEKIIEADDFYQRIDIFLESYMRKYKEPVGDKAAAIRDRIIHTNGKDTVESIAEETGYCRRYLTRVFREAFGMTPKAFSDIIRLQCIIRLFRNGMNEVDNQRLADEFGFYDQSHLLRFFRKYLGITPKNCDQFVSADGYLEKLVII